MSYKCFQSEFEFKNTCLKSLLGCRLPLLSRHFKEATITLCWIAFRDATKSYPVQHEQWRQRAAQVVHTHRTSCWRGWPRGLGKHNSSPHSWIFTSVSVGSSPRSYFFTSVTGRIGVYTSPKCGTKPLRYVTAHFRDQRRAVSLRHRNGAAQTVLMCEEKPHPVWSSRQRQRYPVWYDHSLRWHIEFRNADRTT